jgi:hypothetical protein
MEDRDDLERILLDALPADQRRLTLNSINRTRAKKLAKLRLARRQDADPATLSAEDPPGPTSD